MGKHGLASCELNRRYKTKDHDQEPEKDAGNNKADNSNAPEENESQPIG